MSVEEVAALLDERRGYWVRGLTARVAEVDAALVAQGATPPADDHGPEVRGTGRTASTKPAKG